uniref:Ixodegrins large 9 n=1 Tax=Amblyomma maculatum TaxID=34609 RepID=G3MTI0_AMBMU
MRCVLAKSFLLLFILAMYQITAYYVDEDQHIVNGLVQRRMKDRRRGHYTLRWRYRGEYCESSDDCYPGLCCVQRATRTCQSLSWYGQRCGVGQIKGGCYWRHCPCAYGEDFCQRGVCLL